MNGSVTRILSHTHLDRNVSLMMLTTDPFEVEEMKMHFKFELGFRQFELILVGEKTF